MHVGKLVVRPRQARIGARNHLSMRCVGAAFTLVVGLMITAGPAQASNNDPLPPTFDLDRLSQAQRRALDQAIEDYSVYLQQHPDQDRRYKFDIHKSLGARVQQPLECPGVNEYFIYTTLGGEGVTTRSAAAVEARIPGILADVRQVSGLIGLLGEGASSFWYETATGRAEIIDMLNYPDISAATDHFSTWFARHVDTVWGNLPFPWERYRFLFGEVAQEKIASHRFFVGAGADHFPAELDARYELLVNSSGPTTIQKQVPIDMLRMLQRGGRLKSAKYFYSGEINSSWRLVWPNRQIDRSTDRDSKPLGWFFRTIHYPTDRPGQTVRRGFLLHQDPRQGKARTTVRRIF